MDKDRIIELAREAGWPPSIISPFIVGKLVEFAALIEAEVRGDAEPEPEPVAWQFFQDGKWHNGMDTNNHRANTEAAGIITRDLYTHPSSSVVRQLVKAAKRAMNYAENVVMAEGVYFDDDDDLPFIESTLLAAKEAGL